MKKQTDIGITKNTGSDVLYGCLSVPAQNQFPVFMIFDRMNLHLLELGKKLDEMKKRLIMEQSKEKLKL